MRGHVIFSHGSDSGPQATKVSRLAEVAEAAGFSSERPDYREVDAKGYAAAVPARLDMLLERMRAFAQPPILVGSSMGAFVSGLASLEAPCRGVFLMALPIDIPGVESRFDMGTVPGMLVHGFADALCPADAVVRFARERRLPTLLLDDDHSLSTRVEQLASQFRLFLEHLPA